MLRMKLFSGNSNPALAQSVASYLGVPLGRARVERFSDGEIQVEIQENVRGLDCFVLQSTSAPANRHLMELLIMVDALRRSSARRVTAVIPYYGYARQDRKVAPRVPITAKLVADLIAVAGTDRVLCIDLHAGPDPGLLQHPGRQPLRDAGAAARDPRALRQPNVTIISPDAGGVERARAYAKRLDAPLAIIDKRREQANVAQIMHIIGEVEGQDCVIVDDMVDTAGTLTEAARALREHGAVSVGAAITHPVLSGPAIERIEKSELDTLVVTDTIPLHDGARACGRVRVVSIANLLGEAIRRITNEESVSSLFV
jgi:ribose-phosphate pyrophosphokinase